MVFSLDLRSRGDRTASSARRVVLQGQLPRANPRLVFANGREPLKSRRSPQDERAPAAFVLLIPLRPHPESRRSFLRGPHCPRLMTLRLREKGTGRSDAERGPAMRLRAARCRRKRLRSRSCPGPTVRFLDRRVSAPDVERHRMIESVLFRRCRAAGRRIVCQRFRPAFSGLPLAAKSNRSLSNGPSHWPWDS